MPRPSRFAAIDTGVLLALDAGDEECTGAVDLLGAAGFYCLATETPLQELGDICEIAQEDPEAAERARKTLCHLTNFGFLESSLGRVEMGVAERVARKICEVSLPDGKLNDGLVIAEAAYNNCRILLTRRKALLKSRSDLLRIVLVDADLPPIVMASPAEIIAYYKRR